MTGVRSRRYGWKPFLISLAALVLAIFLIGLLRRWMPLPLAGGVAMFAATSANYWMTASAPRSYADWLPLSLVISALFAGLVFLIQHIGGANNFPSF